MKKFDATSSFSELSRAAGVLNLSLTPANIGYELWEDSHYKGGFTTLSDVADEINRRVELHKIHLTMAVEQDQVDEERRRSEQEERQKPFVSATKMLGKTVPAAVMQNGRVVGYCQAQSGTRSIRIARERTSDGAPINVSSRRISLSEKNVNLAYAQPAFTAFVYDDEIFYVPENTQYSDE